MRNRFIMSLSIIMLLLGAGTFAAAEEELFDTTAAAEHMAKGVKLLGARNYDAAIEELEEAVSAAPSAEAHYLLGYAYYMKGKAGDEDARQQAAENFEQAYEIDPNFSPNKVGPGTVIEAPQAAPEGQTPAEAPPATAPAEAPATAPTTTP